MKSFANRYPGKCFCGKWVEIGEGFTHKESGKPTSLKWQTRCADHRGQAQPLIGDLFVEERRREPAPSIQTRPITKAPTATVAAVPAYRLMSGHEASIYQAAVFEHFQTGMTSAIINAVAGSGKTTTIKNALRYLASNLSVQLFAFNVEAAKQLKAAIVELEGLGERGYSNVKAGTFHSTGFSALRRHLERKPAVNDRKIRNLVREVLAPQSGEKGKKLYEAYADFVCDLVGFARGEGISCLVPDTMERWFALVEHHGIYPDSKDADEEQGIEIARGILDSSNELAKNEGIIDYDDMLYLPLLWRSRLWQTDIVIVDEAQDTNPVRRAFLRLSLKRGGRLYAVGDPRQCQPAGTMVECAYGAHNKHRRYEEAPIESLKPGDMVTSFNFDWGHGVARKINAVSQRPYNGTLVGVSAEGHESWYTPNHKCIIQRPINDFCVYLMRRANAYRVGMSKTNHENVGFGPLKRMIAEDADAIWILSVHGTKRDAAIQEAKASARFGIPQLMFTAKDYDGGFTQADLDEIWLGIENISNAEECLRAFNRQVALPYVTRERVASGQFSLRRPHECYAANLLSGSEIRLRPETKGVQSVAGKWVPAQIKRKQYTGIVYSLSVEKEQLYFADGILTHNSIFGFTGATPDAMDLIAKEFATRELPLTVSYRCGRLIVERAQTWVPCIEAAPLAAAGEVLDDIPLIEALGMLTSKDAVLCRNTAPLVALAYSLIGSGRACRIVGRDIGVGLISLIDKQHAKNFDALLTRLERWRDRQVARFIAKGQDQQAEAVEDRIACISTIAEALPEDERKIPALIERIETIFADSNEGMLTLSTVHRAKGKEWPQVAILRPDLMPARWARQAWQQEQETNLMYVAATRAQSRLIYTKGETKEGQSA